MMCNQYVYKCSHFKSYKILLLLLLLLLLLSSSSLIFYHSLACDKKWMFVALMQCSHIRYEQQIYQFTCI